MYYLGNLRRMRLFVLYLLLITIPFSIFSIVNIGNKGIKPSWFIIMIFIILSFLEICQNKFKMKKNLTIFLVIILNMVAVFSLIKLFNVSFNQIVDFLTQWFRLLLFSLFFISMTNLRLNKNELNKVFKVWIGVSFILSLYGIYQVFARSLGLPFAYIMITNPSWGGGSLTRGGAFGNFVRPSSVFAEPSFFASYLLPLILLLGIPLFYKSSISNFFFKTKKINLIIWIIIFITFLLTFSMGGYIALSIGMVVSFFLVFLFLPNSRKLIKKALILGIIILFLLVLINLFVDIILEVNFIKMVYVRIKAHFLDVFKFLDLFNINGIDSPYAKTSLNERLRRVRAGINVWLKHPIIGAGLNNFGYYFPSNIMPAIHSGFIQCLAEIGFVGFFSLILIYINILYSLGKHIIICINKFENWHSILLAFIFIIITRLIHLSITGNWLNVQVWVELSIIVLSINTLQTNLALK